MRQLPALLSALLFATGALAQPALEQEAQALSREFVSRLKPQLQQAMAAGGPAHAIAVCAEKAPQLADALSSESGWQVRRVSLRSRNPSRAIPDEWERSVLAEFDRRAAAGENPAELAFGEQVGSHYRYLQAQGVGGVCLTCHGSDLTDPVLKALDDYYPDDTATGYLPGQVRGAISLTRTLP